MGFAQEIDHLFDRELLKGLAETSEGFVEFDRGVLHVIVRAFRAAHEQEMLGPGDAMLAVAVQPHAEKTDDLTLGLFRFLFRLLIRFTGHRSSSLPPKSSSRPLPTISGRIALGQLQTVVSSLYCHSPGSSPRI